MILTRSTRLSQPQGPVEPIGTWAAVSVPGGWLGGDANPVESASGNVVFRNRTEGGLATTISSSGAYVSYGTNARMQLSSSSGVIAFVAPSFATPSSLFSTNLANTVTTNAFYVAAYSTGCAIQKANTAGIITTTNAPVAGRLNVLAWRYNNATGDAALALNGVLTKATSAQTFTHGTVARGRFRLTDTAQAGTHNQLLFAITPRQIGDAELLALSRNPWQLFRPVQRRVYFDMGAGGGTSPVSSDQSASYAIRGEVSSDQAASYAIRSSVSADLSASYDIQTAIAVSSDLSSGYAILAAAQADAAAAYIIRASVQANSSAAYAIRSSVQADAGAAFFVRAAVLSDTTASYVVRTNASADLSAAYEIQTASGVVASLDASYNVRAAVQSDASAAYDLRTSVGAASEHAFMVRGLVSSDLDASFTVEAPITQVYADLQAAYLVDGGAVFIPSQFVASVPAGVFSARAPAGEYSATVPS